jgi:5-oxoprolinase (ATP-hydrolysing) subunit A
VRTIDLNCDMGESFGAYTIGADEEVLRSISSANVACGFHGGDPGVMRRTIRMARERGVAVGAHPGFPDLAGFGRREMRMAPQDVEDMVLYQIGALAGIAASEGVRLQHVKAHGALYNMAARDRTLADAIARAVRAFDPALILFVLPASDLQRAGEAAGLPIALEGFADRAYEPDGSLTPRSRHGSVIHDGGEVVRRATRMATDGRVTATDGSEIQLRVDTICTHGDTPGAHELTRLLRAGLERAGVGIKSLADLSRRGAAQEDGRGGE